MATKLLGISLRETEDILMRQMLQSCASIINCTSGNNGQNPTEITRPDVNVVTRALYGNSAASITEGIEGMNKYGTAPKTYGRVKSSLIDLETVVAIS